MKKVKFLQAKTQKSSLFVEIFFMLPNKSFPKHFVTACLSMAKLFALNKKFSKTTIIHALRLENQHITSPEWSKHSAYAKTEHENAGFSAHTKAPPATYPLRSRCASFLCRTFALPPATVLEVLHTLRTSAARLPRNSSWWLALEREKSEWVNKLSITITITVKNKRCLLHRKPLL